MAKSAYYSSIVQLAASMPSIAHPPVSPASRADDPFRGHLDSCEDSHIQTHTPTYKYY